MPESPGDQIALSGAVTSRMEHVVYEWRRDELERAGYDAESAIVLASCVDVDLHEACDLLRRGCSVEIARQILL